MADLEHELQFYRQQCNDLGARLLRLQEELARARRDDRRSRTAAQLIREIYRLADANVSIDEIGRLFLQIILDNLGVYRAALLRYLPGPDCFTAYHALGFSQPEQLRFSLPALPGEYYFVNSSSPAEPVLDGLRQAAGVPYLLWSFNLRAGLALLLGNLIEDQHIYRPFEAGDREIVESALSVFIEILERKRAEEALRESEEKYRLLFEMESDAIILIDVETLRQIDANEAALRMYGYSREEMLLLKSTDMSAEPEETRARVQAGGDIVNIPLRYHRKKDGRVFPVEISARFFTLQERQALLVAIRDITARVRAEAEREKLIAELEAKNTELERFTYTVSHDLKSPLITINGFLGWLEKDTARGDSVRVQQDIQQIRDGVEKMKHLLEDLLELSRIGRVVNAPEEIPLSDLAYEAVNLVAGQIAEKGVRVDVAPDLPVVYGDRLRLLEVLQNLLDNAVKFMGEQPEPWVEIGGRLDSQEVICYVRDNGIGIEPRHQEKIFDLFERLGQVTPGTGIGLALVKRIVEVHGGRIWVESEGQKQGSTFYIALPR
jgi:PAS domain S-box-containing protein